MLVPLPYRVEVKPVTEATLDATRILQDLVRIPSHERESEAVEYLARRCDSLGVTYTVREIMPGGRESITAEWGGGAKSLILNSHLDTVSPGDPDKWSSPPYGAVVTGGRMYGRGTADAKGSLAAMIAAFESLVRDGTPLDGKLILMAVGLEEALGVLCGDRLEVCNCDGHGLLRLILLFVADER